MFPEAGSVDPSDPWETSQQLKVGNVTFTLLFCLHNTSVYPKKLILFMWTKGSVGERFHPRDFFSLHSEHLVWVFWRKKYLSIKPEFYC